MALLKSHEVASVERRPALEKCAKQGGVFVAKPAENLRKVPETGVRL
jgi:hypothetical protein